MGLNMKGLVRGLVAASVATSGAMLVGCDQRVTGEERAETVEDFFSRAEQEGTQEDPVVFLKPNRAIYHVKDCNLLRRGPMEVVYAKRSEVESKGGEPCSMCRPDEVPAGAS